MLNRKAALSSAAASCSWAYEHANDRSRNGSGNIPDSANAAKQFIVAIWDGLISGRKPDLIRTDSCKYELRVDGQVRAGPIGSGC